MRSEVASQLDLQELRYSMVWEDHELLGAGLQIGPDDDVLSITSAGNNVLSLLLREPRTITAIDMSPAQCALFELKLTGIRELDVEGFRTLLGFGGDPRAVYEEIRAALSAGARAFWDGRADVVAAGIHGCGRLERYFAEFHGRHVSSDWRRLLRAEWPIEQRAVFAEVFTPAFQAAFREYFGRDSMARHGRDPAQFAYVEDGDVGGYFLRRFEHVCTALPTAGNFYVERFLTGGHADLDAGPEYLRAAEFGRLKGLVDRVRVVEAELETHLAEVEPGTYSKAQLSDVFEYMSEVAAEALFERLAEAVRPGGRVAYWNLLVPRSPRTRRLRWLEELSNELWARDRSWFYRAFRVEEVQPC